MSQSSESDRKGKPRINKATAKRTVLNIFIDLVLVAASICFSVGLRWDFSVKQIPVKYIESIGSMMFFYLVIHLVVFILFGLYRHIRLYTSIGELLQVASAELVASACCFCLSLLKKPRMPISIAVISCGMSFLLIGLVRIIPRLRRLIRTRKTFRQYKEVARILIVGAGDAGAALEREFSSAATHAHKVVGFVDDDLSKQGLLIHNVPILGTTKDIPRLAYQLGIREVVIAIPSASKAEINQILDECRKTECKIRIMPSIHKLQKADQLSTTLRDVDITDLLGRDEIVLDTEAISDYLTDKVVLVTGGGGSIGSELCRQIIQFNPKLLVILDIYENNAYDLQMELAMNYNLHSDKVKVIIGSVRDREMLRRLFAKYRPEVVLHAAAHKHVPLMEDSPLEALKNNVFGTYNVACTASEFGVRRMVLISTDKAVNPTNVMGATKRLAEMVILGVQHGSSTEFVAVRFGNVLGSNGSVLPLFKKQIQHGGPVTVTHPDITRFFMTIPEAARLVLQAGAMAKGGEIFILDMGQPVRIADMARDLIKLSGYEPDKDIMIKYVGLRPGEKLYEELMLAEEGTTETTSRKIFTAKPQDISREELEEKLAKVRACIEEDGDVRAVLKEIVPTYRGDTH